MNMYQQSQHNRGRWSLWAFPTITGAAGIALMILLMVLPQSAETPSPVSGVAGDKSLPNVPATDLNVPTINPVSESPPEAGPELVADSVPEPEFEPAEQFPPNFATAPTGDLRLSPVTNLETVPATVPSADPFRENSSLPLTWNSAEHAVVDSPATDATPAGSDLDVQIAVFGLPSPPALTDSQLPDEAAKAFVVTSRQQRLGDSGLPEPAGFTRSAEAGRDGWQAFDGQRETSESRPGNGGWEILTTPAVESSATPDDDMPAAPRPANEEAIVAKTRIGPIVAPSSQTTVHGPILRLRVSGPKHVKQGESFALDFEIENTGSVAVSDVALTVDLSKHLSYRYGRALIRPMGDLAPGETRKVRLTAQATASGTAAVQAAVSAARMRLHETRCHLEIVGTSSLAPRIVDEAAVPQ